MRQHRSTHPGLTTPHPRGSPMPVRHCRVHLTCVSLIILSCIAVDALAACTGWERHWLLPKLGCSRPAIEAICTGQRAMPGTRYCGGTELPPARMGDWCQLTMGGCQLPALAPLASTCECQTSGGTVRGWVSRQEWLH
jgi:hypothetical protein